MAKKKEILLDPPEENLPLIDGHCHFPWGSFQFDETSEKMPRSYEQQYKDFFANGGKFIISCPIDLESMIGIKKFTETHEKVGITYGWAPQTVTYTPKSEHEEKFEKWLKILKMNPKSYLGIGEIGLDFHHAKIEEKRIEQINIFRKIIHETKKLHKPYILHIRNPTLNDRDTKNIQSEFNEPDSVNRIILEILSDEKIPAEKVIWHCFSGPKDWGKRLAERGFYLSVPSSAYGFKKWRSFIEDIPLESLLTETDSRFQHPFTYEGFNEPFNVRYSIAAIAYQQNLSQWEVAEQIIRNFNKIYDLRISS